MLEAIRDYTWVMPLLPLAGATLNRFVGARFGERGAGWIASAALGASFLFALATFVSLAALPEDARQWTNRFAPWIEVGGLKVDVAYLVDPLSAVMCLIVTGVGTLVHVYSIGYMRGEPCYDRYYGYLSLFCFAMLNLVLADNLLLLFLGWEGVGVCSYWLIGFWFTDLQKAAAGFKAFLVNRIGDLGFLLGIFVLFWHYADQGHPTLTFQGLAEHVDVLQGATFPNGLFVATVVGMLLFVGATGKSAQIPLYIWLPDAMVGPTPVSALIHAATMVTAGVYMIARLHFLYEAGPGALHVVAGVGVLTAILGGVLAIVQNDIKKVLAYSTISQLGYMFLAMGVGAYASGIFHLTTHALFKACLFLSAGSVIHLLHHEHDIRRMGGFRKAMPRTYLAFFVSALAISGIPPLAGYFSKDQILWHALAGPHGHLVLWLGGAVTAFMTAFYMFRLVFLVFWGHCRAEDPEIVHHIEEAPATMTVPLLLLATLAAVGGFIGFPEPLGDLVGWAHSNTFQTWLAPVLPVTHAAPHHSRALEFALMPLAIANAVAGIALAWWLYLRHPGLPTRLRQRAGWLYRLLIHRLYIEEIYDAFVVRVTLFYARACALFDLFVVDGAVRGAARAVRRISTVGGWTDARIVDGAVNGAGALARLGGRGLRRAQSGVVQRYVLVATAGVLVLVAVKWIVTRFAPELAVAIGL